MPYARNSELPEAVRNALPAAAQTIFRNVVNSQEERGLSTERAFASAWGALKNQGWVKNEDTGKWHKVEKLARVLKVDAAKQYVFGWASIAVRKDGEVVIDSQDDIIDPEDLEDGGYEFVLRYRETGCMHEGDACGALIESFVVTPEKLEKMGLPPDALPQGWWLGFHVADEAAFAKVVDGTYAMFSIQGRAVREAMEDD